MRDGHRRRAKAIVCVLLLGFVAVGALAYCLLAPSSSMAEGVRAGDTFGVWKRLLWGEDPNGQIRGESYLYVAASNADRPMVELLLDHGADPLAECGGGINAVVAAILYGRDVSLAETMLHSCDGLRGAPGSDLPWLTLMTCLWIEDEAELQAKAFALLVSSGLDVHGESGAALLASGVETVGTARLLVENGADVTCELSMGGRSGGILQWAVLQSPPEVVDYLIQSGAPLDIPGSSGSLPLHICARRGSLEVVTLLVRHGADLSARNSSGRTPLELAEMRKDDAAVADYLRQAAGRPNEGSR